MMPAKDLGTTERLRLRLLSMEDAADVFHYASNPAVSELTLWAAHKTIADSETFIREYCFGNYSEDEPEPYGIVELRSGRLIGTVGCFWVSRAHRSMELGYALAEDAWGNGYIVEAAKLLLKHVFTTYPVDRIQCRCKVENQRSARVMAKLGFRVEGVARSAYWHRERTWDALQTSLLRAEFLDTSGG